ncbi:MAG TPA: LapA family protein [Thermodesulfovibrionales bacterium]|jgi:uncharacterized integral membrane protein|nr:LapA family protein [Thermodesulfovibrionales bacterium]
MQLFLFLAFIIAVIVVLFAVQNASIITISFLSYHFQGSLPFVLVIIFASGFVTGVLMMLPSSLRKSLALREQKKKVKALQEGMTKESLHSQTKDPRTL